MMFLLKCQDKYHFLKIRSEIYISKSLSRGKIDVFISMNDRSVDAKNSCY